MKRFLRKLLIVGLLANGFNMVYVPEVKAQSNTKEINKSATKISDVVRLFIDFILRLFTAKSKKRGDTEHFEDEVNNLQNEINKIIEEEDFDDVHSDFLHDLFRLSRDFVSRVSITSDFKPSYEELAKKLGAIKITEDVTYSDLVKHFIDNIKSEADIKAIIDFANTAFNDAHGGELLSHKVFLSLVYESSADFEEKPGTTDSFRRGVDLLEREMGRINGIDPPNEASEGDFGSYDLESLRKELKNIDEDIPEPEDLAGGPVYEDDRLIIKNGVVLNKEEVSIFDVELPDRGHVYLVKDERVDGKFYRLSPSKYEHFLEEVKNYVDSYTGPKDYIRSHVVTGITEKDFINSHIGRIRGSLERLRTNQGYSPDEVGSTIKDALIPTIISVSDGGEGGSSDHEGNASGRSTPYGDPYGDPEPEGGSGYDGDVPV